MAEMPARRTIEELAKDLGTPDWLFAAVKSLKRWAEGQEVYPDDYLDAVEEAAHVSLSYGDLR